MTSKKESPTEAPGKNEGTPDQNSTATSLQSEMDEGGIKADQGSTQPSARNIGRPRVRFEALKPVPTRCPAQIYTYLKGISPFLYGSLTEMFEDMMTRFTRERPWEHGLHWRKPKTATTFANGEQGKTGWEQVNMQLPQKLAEEVAKTSSECGVSNAAFCYTAIFWWVQYIYPPDKMVSKK